MWYVWCALLLVSRALGAAEVAEVAETTTEEVKEVTTDAPAPVATTRAPPRTLDRKAADLAWRIWLQSPESGNLNAPPRRITTKSLFITPLVCPKGQRLDNRNGCIQLVSVGEDEHQRMYLEQLNKQFPSAPSGDIVYDYGDEDPGPLQLSIPIGLDPQAAPLQANEPAAEAQEQLSSYVKIDKKDEDKTNNDASIEAELELLKLQNRDPNNANLPDGAGILNHNVLNNFLQYADKPKRDSPVVNETETQPPTTTTTDQGQKEQFYGHVNVDPVLYGTEYQKPQYDSLPKETEVTTEQTNESPPAQVNATFVNNTASEKNESSASPVIKKTSTEVSTEKPIDVMPNLNENLTKDGDKSKLSPESEYSDIGEAIKLISRYAEVTTDDNFTKDQKKYALKDESVLGTRTRLQHRRNKPQELVKPPAPIHVSPEEHKEMLPPTSFIPKNEGYYRYPWSSQHAGTPPPDYPFRHLQDYWPDRSKIGGVYGNVGHENPRRHHHTYQHSYFRPHGFPDARAGLYLRLPDAHAGQPAGYPYRLAPQHANVRSHNQDLYTLLGLRHWFSSEITSKR